jgi:hypothetical protein
VGQAAALSARRAAPDEVRAFAARAMCYATTDEPLDELLHAGECWIVEEGGHAVAGWVQQWQGRNLHVLLYGGAASVDLSNVLDACLAAQRPASASFNTRRRGLIRKAIEKGYAITREFERGVVMKKEF